MFIYSAGFFIYSVFFLYIQMRLELFMIKCAIIEYVVGGRAPIGARLPTIFHHSLKHICIFDEEKIKTYNLM